jgi:hypothetical protein
VTVDILHPIDVLDYAKIPGAGESRYEFPACGRTIEVAHKQRDAAYVEIRRIAEENQLNHRGEKTDAEHFPVLPKLEEFFADDVKDRFHEIIATTFSVEVS